ncbi:uncharacterized protein LOC132624194 [Lycium barbarum]|uniref:uncharacterized protein LOC132624194 n=1 Tax=Lycium barbarum TaxID=112863 RepID=UPI00293F31AB|nr:uncharacterized protein LOC132624194 [Lycium barbarum]
MIQGFNQGGKRAIGVVKLEINMGGHDENKVVPSTYHQCFKYLENGVQKKIVANDEPFVETEAHFADAKFYLKNCVSKEFKVDNAMPIKKVGTAKMDDPTAGKVKVIVEKNQALNNVSKVPKVNMESSRNKNTSFLHYVPKAKTGEGHSSELQGNMLSGLTFPIKQIDAIKSSSKMVEGFFKSSNSHESLPEKRTDEGFDPNAYKLLAKAGYNPNEPSKLGKFLPEAVGKGSHGLNPTQRMMIEKGYAVKQSHEGLGYKQPSPVRISIRRASNNYITTKEESTASNQRLSVFDRLTNPTPRISVFDRLGPLKKKYKHQGNNRRMEAPVYAQNTTLHPRVEEKFVDIHACHHISFNDGDPQEDEDAEDAPPEFEEGVKTTIDALKEVNLGTGEDPRPTYVSASLNVDEENKYVELLMEFKDVFAWSYKEMPGLDPKVAVHRLAVKGGTRPVKQAQRCFRSELVPLIETEVNKLIEAGFIREVKDLNNACPKDEFPIPIPELMIDAMTGYEAMSFMDGSSGYNQIRMAPKDEELTAFRTPKGIYCYKVMPFGLKNAGATYQRAMQKIFDHMLHKNAECYVDDLVVKSRERNDHLKDLRLVFERLRRYQLKMNPLKCAFGVSSGKFLGFIVRQRGIEIDQAKVDAILKMPEPKYIHELKSLQGKLAYLRRFISNLAGRCQPFSRLMKKDIPFEWDQACVNAFESIKSYLMKPPVLVAPIPGKLLILYIAAQERSVGALLAEENDKRKENALYYLSRMMTPNEINYSPIEKLCLALVFSIQKMKHYFQAHVVRLVSKANPIKFVMSKPVLSDRLARWYLQFQKFEIVYISQKAAKGQVLADFLANHPIPDDWELFDELLDEDAMLMEIQPPWKMYFDGAAHCEGAGAGIVFVTSLGELQIFGDSKLVINQVLGSYEVKKPELLPYRNYAQKLIGWLGEVTIQHVPRKENKKADALAALASALVSPNQMQVVVCQRWVVPPPNECEEEVEHAITTLEVEIEDWRQPIIDYLCYGILLENLRRKTEIRRRAPRFLYYKNTLYRRSFDGVLLRCLGADESVQAMQEAHSGVCGAHQSGPKLHFHIKRMGYYWKTMVKDYLDYARRCKACQFHANFIHQPPEVLHPTVASWTFEAWGLDVVGPLPKSSGGHLYILAVTDYFSKWAEAVSLKEVKKENVANFIRVNIIYRFGIPRYILTDNGKPFDNKLMTKVCDLFGFKQRNSSMYYAAANGLAEEFNKTLCNLLKNVVSKSKRDWHERMEEALWAYRTTYRTPTQATPYLPVYVVEAVLPLERQIPSLRLAIQEGLTDEENARLRLEELEALDEKRLEAQQSLECYQARLSRSFNKRVRLRCFQVGDQVLVVRRPIITSHRSGGKFSAKWDGPYVVQEVYLSGAFKLVDSEGLRIGPINGKFMKRYYP